VDEQLPDPLRRPPVAHFGPDPRQTALTGVGAVLVAALSFATDTAGRLLLIAAALILAGYALTDLLFRPRLTVDAAGIRVRSPLARADLAWPDVTAIRADERSRYGLRSVTLEIDGADQLIVLSRRALGAPPDAVAALVRSFDPRQT
jgi:PH (Pleckstrin Homology) domain-containing protein